MSLLLLPLGQLTFMLYCLPVYDPSEASITFYFTIMVFITTSTTAFLNYLSNPNVAYLYLSIYCDVLLSLVVVAILNYLSNPNVI
jgi:hypothetical protein